MSQENKKQLAPKITAICKKHGIKATLAVRHYSTLVLNVRSGKIEFHPDEHYQVNTYHIETHYQDQPAALAFLTEVRDAMMEGNHDRSDILTDYFDVGWYIDINLGQWDKPYLLTK